jgi:hypothetical protein
MLRIKVGNRKRRLPIHGDVGNETLHKGDRKPFLEEQRDRHSEEIIV